jgi:hypothetical protein
MRNAMPSALMLALVFGGCGNNGVPANGNDGGMMGGGADLSSPSGPGISIGPFNVPAGQETTQCVTVRLPSTVDADYVAIVSTLAKGSHHLIVYTSTATQENTTPTTCTSFSGVLSGLTPVYIAQTLQSTLTLPTGVAYHFPAGQMFQIEAHYLNATAADINAMGSVTFVPATTGGTFQAADIMFCGSVKQLGGIQAAVTGCPVGGGLPAGTQTTLTPGFYAGGKGVDLTKLKFFGFTGHQHHFGTDVKLWKSTSAAPNASPPVYESTSWDNAPLEVFNDSQLLSFNAGEGIEWQCSYDTTGATSNTCFGESARDNEMCFFWAYYFPSVGRFVNRNDCWQ